MVPPAPNIKELEPRLNNAGPTDTYGIDPFQRSLIRGIIVALHLALDDMLFL